MKKVAGTLKLIYSQYRELQSFAQFGSDLDADTKSRLDQGARIVEVLKQNQNTPITMEKQVAILYAVTRGMLASIPVDKIHAFETELFSFLDTDADGAAAMQAIRTTKNMDEDTEAKLKSALESFTKDFTDRNS
jgi:F-type H+-transporting ATPase subunit alpha